MQFDYKFMRSGGHVRIAISGKITSHECQGLIERVMCDPHLHPNSTALIDLRDATYEREAKAEVIDIATALETFHFLLKNNIAIVAMRSTLFYAEIFSAHVRAVTNVGIKVFVDIAAAEAFCMAPNNGA